MEESALLREIEIREKESALSQITMCGVPLWRLVRYQARMCYISQHSDYQTSTAEPVFVGKRRIKLFSGFWKCLFSKDLTLFYTFNRLVYNSGNYLDKFIDPVVELSSLGEAPYAIIDSPNYVGNYPRLHKHNVISNDARTVSKQILKNVLLISAPLLFKKKVQLFFKIAQPVYNLDDSFIKMCYRKLSLFMTEYIYDMFWFKVLAPKRVFVVLREGYFPQISVCKRLKIPVAEFQHGITLDKTVSYTGDYDVRIDPDFFLTFGTFWKGDYFGMPKDRIYCIGWAYSKYLASKITKDVNEHINEVLVISSAEISDSILDALAELSNKERNYSFHIRLHPCESYNERQREKLLKIPNAIVVDNKQDSAVVLPTYRYVIGENSSVIYEAMSVGCKVGMLNLCGLRPPIYIPGIKESFFIINNKEDFSQFIGDKSSEEGRKEGFYSEFDNKSFMSFINKSM